MDYRRFSVSRRQKEPLLAFIISALRASGCSILRSSSPSEAPFRISFETPDGERMGIIAYAFVANSRLTKNRPSDEHRFQVKYGPKTSEFHDLWQDPYGLYTTLFIGINVEQGFFVAADPLLHSPTRFYISVEFKDKDVKSIFRCGWHSWERERRTSGGLEEPVEVMVGGVPEQFLRYVRFERAARGLDSGHRGLLADKLGDLDRIHTHPATTGSHDAPAVPHIHQLASEFQLTESEIFDLIESAPRLKIAVRGWVAEAHLVRRLRELSEITECSPIEEDGRPDVRVSLEGSRLLYIECKNILRRPYKDGSYRLDFQRTRAPKGDPCSRYYAPAEFDVVAACLHPRTEQWDFSYALVQDLSTHDRCPGRLSNRVILDERWGTDILRVLNRALVH